MGGEFVLFAAFLVLLTDTSLYCDAFKVTTMGTMRLKVTLVRRYIVFKRLTSYLIVSLLFGTFNFEKTTDVNADNYTEKSI